MVPARGREGLSTVRVIAGAARLGEIYGPGEPRSGETLHLQPGPGGKSELEAAACAANVHGVQAVRCTRGRAGMGAFQSPEVSSAGVQRCWGW
ncbi:hypothetical protein NDU88_000994 [Pleurodeles waltl]|uniref:Uncharacterized protein n=1 Tax=Pleurodeles waltl TaxID=8319 RepID=A0AAV7LY77_PLEWA|nr:hypothetical protein NDU88_000994 [Pleurodeles waltl]